MVTTPRLIAEGAVRVTVPDICVAFNHVPFAGVVVTVAVQLSGLAQAPAAVMVMAWAAGTG